MELFESWALSLIVFLPIAGALVALAIPKEREEAVKLWALLVSGVTLLLAVIVAVRFDYGAAAQFQFEVDLPWIGAIDPRTMCEWFPSKRVQLPRSWRPARIAPFF